MKTKIYRHCPFCGGDNFSIETVSKQNNLYLLSCNNPNIASSMYVQLNKRGRYSQVNVQSPKPVQRQSAFINNTMDKLQTPFWKLMGQKAKPQDIAYEKYLKSRNMTYGDAWRERNANAQEKSSYEQFSKTR